MAITNLLKEFLACRKVCTDTRKITGGELFFALRGPAFDGNLFAKGALSAGVAKVVVDDPNVVVQGDERFILVPDVLIALQDLARAYRKTFSFPILAITGTNGKTTTKELVSAVLAAEKKVHFTHGNLNNHIGVPLTLLEMSQSGDIAILEMGANKPGDIAELAAIGLPNMGLITNIGQAHLERFGNIEGVQSTKGELFEFIRKHNGLAFINENDPRVLKVAEGIQSRITYGTKKADFYIEHAEFGKDCTTLLIRSRNWPEPVIFNSKVVGRHNAENILAAVAVGYTLGISISGMQKGVAAYVPTNNRTQIIKMANFTLLLDAYNANPSSMEAAIGGIFAQESGRVGLVLGDMFELGASSETLHRELGLFLNQFPVKKIILIGKDMEFANAVVKAPCTWYKTTEEAKSGIEAELQNLDYVLIKGSRGMALEKLLSSLS